MESEGIESYIADEHMVSLNPGYDIALGGIKLQVKKSNVLQALKILGFESESEKPISPHPQKTTIKCQKCGEESEIKVGIKFCGSCGAKLPDSVT